MLIFLIGMPGSGKTTLGLQLAKHRCAVFLDLDLAVEARMGTTISEAFESEGEDYFRNVEKGVLQEVVKTSDAVIAAGGGTPCYFNNLQIMKKAGLTIFLDVSAKELIPRLEATASERPLLAGENLGEEIDNLYRNRREIYEQAHLKIASDSISVDDLVKLISNLDQENQK